MVLLMKKRSLELLMGMMLLVSFFLLSRETARAVESQRLERQRILIDAGHGGSDPGMVGRDGIEEKTVNLSIALKLKEVLKADGFEVLMTREEDEGLYDETSQNKKVQDLQRRCDLIAEKEPVLTVSIHQNSYPDESVKGPQVFYYEHSAEGKELAERIQEELNQQLQVERKRQVKGNASYYLLKRSKGVLNIVECGFLSNPQEAALLLQEEYQKKVAEAVAEGIRKYLERKG